MDSLNDALVECVKACGGSKQVGPLLWPEKSPDAAQRLLLDCLNDERPAHLTPDAVMLIMRMAHAKGFHGGMGHICQRLGYAAPVPITPVDEAAALHREFIEASHLMATLVAKIERLQPVGGHTNYPNLRAA